MQDNGNYIWCAGEVIGTFSHTNFFGRRRPQLGGGPYVALRIAGYAVGWVRDGGHARQALRDQVYGVCILDLGLPRVDGLRILKELRALENHTPVLILTARDTPSDRVGGLDAGADDYLVKPFDLPELLARVRALARRAGGSVAPTLVRD